MTEILAFAGSARPASPNRALLEVAASGARERGAKVKVVDLAHFPLPLFDADGVGRLDPSAATELAAPFPQAATELAALVAAAEGLLLASPEVNGGAAPLLLNALGWLGASAALEGKVCGIVSSSPAAGGGVRGLGALSSTLAALGAIIVPMPVAVLNGVMDARLEDRVKDVGRSLAAFIDRRVPQ